MRLNTILIIMLIMSVSSYAQQKSTVLFSINDEPVSTEEFLQVYNKNKDIISSNEESSVESYLDLFVNYKLKVKDAKEHGLDTVQKFKTELAEYKEQLAAPYLKDETVTQRLVLEAYERKKKEINGSHILLLIHPEAPAKDTLQAYNKLIDARNRIINGESFSAVAKEVSQDRSANKNGGNLGYFSALQMVYPFENVAYNTPVGEISMPFRTKFGFHIVQIHDERPSKGMVEVAHIMIRKNSENSKEKIDSIYNEVLKDSSKFKSLAISFSEDKASAPLGGKLRKFSSGQMIDSFADVAFSLQKPGEISEPFNSEFGWHIVKLIEKYPIKPFEEEKAELTRKVENDQRSQLIGKSVIERLMNEYEIIVHDKALNQFAGGSWKTSPENFQETLLEVEERKIKQAKFIKYLKLKKAVKYKIAFENFKEQEILNYYKDNLEFTNKEFAATYKEFEEGLLLFDRLEQVVWQKSKDSVALNNYFEQNKNTKFQNKDLTNNKGAVISDFQTYLEESWVNSLHQTYNVYINKKEKKRLIRSVN